MTNTCLNCGEQTANKKFCSISCQNRFQNSEKADKKYGILKDFQVICGKCGRLFYVKEREKLFPQKEKYYCNRSCANSRNHNKKTKDKISKKLKSNTRKKIKLVCKNCNKEFEVYFNKRGQQCCSMSCAATWRNINKGVGRIGGLASAKKQSKKRRSKNEILFFELCEKEFNNVKHNEPLFNGWDADVIIEDYKVAVLWNGKWHYQKLTKQHSVKQVQNRDKIKINEIQKCGYKPYIIRDLGRGNVKFVRGEFEKFLDFCNKL